MVSVRTAVGRLNGVSKFSADEKARTVTVEFDPATLTPEAIRGAMERVGYESTVLA